MAVLLRRRSDGHLDIYRQPGLTLDPEMAQVGGELGEWRETAIDPARFDISPSLEQRVAAIEAEVWTLLGGPFDLAGFSAWAQTADPVDATGRHHEVENLYVFDGSLFPTSVGANPQLSIYGITAKLATELLDLYCREFRPRLLRKPSDWLFPGENGAHKAAAALAVARQPRLVGLGVGLLTGFFGVGGGFLIVSRF